jgi:hypothetical protein
MKLFNFKEGFFIPLLCEDTETSIKIRVAESRERKGGKGLIFGIVGFTLVFFILFFYFLYIYWFLEFCVLSMCIIGG